MLSPTEEVRRERRILLLEQDWLRTLSGDIGDEAEPDPLGPSEVTDNVLTCQSCGCGGLRPDLGKRKRSS